MGADSKQETLLADDENSAGSGEAQRSKHAKKRSSAQKAADALFIETLAIRGLTQAEISERLAAERPYRISRSQVQADLEQIKRRWLANADQAFASARARALRTLDALERAAWDLVDAPDDATGQGNARVLAVHDRRIKILGLEAPVRNEISGPEAGPIVVSLAEPGRVLDDARKSELLRRHALRVEEDAAANDET